MLSDSDGDKVIEYAGDVLRERDALRAEITALRAEITRCQQDELDYGREVAALRGQLATLDWVRTERS